MPPQNSPNANPAQGEGLPPVSNLKQIRTFQGDVASALSRQNESLISIQQSEVLKKRAVGISVPSSGNDAEYDGKRKDFLFLLIGSIVFILLGLSGAWYGYREIVKRSAPPVIATPQNRFISANSEITLDVTSLNRESLGTQFSENIRDLGPENLRHVVLQKRAGELTSLISSSEFLSLLESRAPGSFIRSLDNLFMVGAVGESRFTIFKLSSFENAFAGMLSWEATLAEDLTPVFANAEALKAIAPASVFKDVIIRNKDVRVLYAEGVREEVGASTTAAETGEAPRLILMYSFFDNNMLIITDRVETLQLLIERLTRERLSR